MNAPETLPTATLATVPLAHILPSPTNPRRRRNAAADAELAENIRTHGILQPQL